MNFSKGALRSTGIWGGLIAALPQVAAMIDPQLGGIVTDAISVAGGLLAVYGRWSATTRIDRIL